MTTSNGAGTIYLAATESGLANTNVGSFTIGFIDNGVSSTPVTKSVYIGSNITLTMMPLSTSTSQPNTILTSSYAAPALATNHNVAEQFVLQFTGARQQGNATISKAANSVIPTVVPELASFILLGITVAGIVAAWRRRAG